MEFQQLQSFLLVLVGICALIASISGASAAVVKFWRYAHRQSDENAITIDQILSYLGSDKRRIESLEATSETLEDRLKLILRGVYHLLNHEIDGNHTDQLIQTRDAIQESLFDN